MNIVVEGHSHEHGQAQPLSLEELRQQLETSEKRRKDLQSYHDKIRTGLEQENARLRKESSVFTPPKSAEELEEWFQDKPDWRGVIETVAHKIADSSLKPIQEDLNKAKQEKAGAELLRAHPDAVAISQSEDFQAWAQAQGPEIQEWLADEYDSSKVIRALNYYKAMRSHQTTTPQTIIEPSAADAVSTHGSVVTPQTQSEPQVFTRAQIEKMNQHEYKANLAAIQEAYSKGLIR